ncbi:MAG TPA: polysaccharide biosynthesis tyrosine autokinase [Actinomycetota bacterium]|nr:polysaccharide biosynthesis tyrosine autokinase [Actinomycetota bacterium]
MVEPAPGGEAGDLRLYLQIARRRIWSILGVTAVTVASALAVSFTRTPIYASTARIQVKPPTANLLLQNVPVTSLVSLDTERQVATSTEVLERAAATLGLPTGPASLEAFAEGLSAGAPANTQILEITYEHPDPVEAQRRAQAVADAYLDFKTDQLLEAAQRVRRAIQGQIDQIRGRLTVARERLAEAEPGSAAALQAQASVQALEGQAAALQAQLGELSILDISPGTVIQPASLPTEPSSPNHLMNGGLALAVGLALGVGLAFLRERLDAGVGSRGELERLLQAPVLATVPRVRRRRRRKAADDLVTATDTPGPVAEAYRSIRTNLQVMARNSGLRTLAVVSARAGEQKTTTAANLAAALARSGRRTVVVSCDLRRPRLHEVFSVPREPGLTDLLASDLPITAAVHPTALEHLRVMPSGAPAGNPAEILESEAFRQALDRLRARADFVILDTPPLLAVADALPVAAAVDGVLFLVDPATPTNALELARDHLVRVGARVVGAVLTNVDHRRMPAAAGYYYYAYDHRPEPRGGNGSHRAPAPARDGGDGAPRVVPDDASMWRAP